jgi:leucyl-tRNA synthetase
MFDHKKIEEKWQKKWQKDGVYQTSDSVPKKENKYVLFEFPYPSGDLHVGHWYAFAVTDIYTRFLRMQGANVLFPIGFDAFGLPAENAAIKRGLNPREWTFDNIAYMRTQLLRMGTSIDWSREIVTADPAYYKWTQWLFLKFFEHGLAYQKETAVNWCPSCQTVLANEQVVGGQCQRCDTEVEQRQMLQWNIKITEYAEHLLSDLEELDWPEPIKESQRQWIGKKEGAEIDFKINGTDEVITVFTTRPDTLFGATYLVCAPEHSWILNAIQKGESSITNTKEVADYIQKAGRKTERQRQENKEKTGVEIQGISAINPATGEEIPVWVADYVLAGYGTGAIMAVPAHDERDFEFSRIFDLPMRCVIDPGEKFFLKDVKTVGRKLATWDEEKGERMRDAIKENRKRIREAVLKEDACFFGEGILFNSGKFDGMTTEESWEKIVAEFGTKKTTYRLRDWLISRQRYWGCPIPIVHCDTCGAVPVLEKELPVVLPEIDDYLPAGDGKSPLAKATAWVQVPCPKCGAEARRETDTFDTFIDSSWYFLRYTDPHNEEEFASREKQEKWMPVDFYSGGAEHTTMHLLYSRFFHKALFDMGLVVSKEPYKKRLNRGLILGPDGNKMSKSKGNVVNPDEVVEQLGADTVRTYLAFIGPYNELGAYPWNPDSSVGVRRFLERVAHIGEIAEWSEGISPQIFNQTIQQVTEALMTYKMNTGVSALMTCLNEIRKVGISEEQWGIFLRLLAPYAPHLAEELWEKYGNTESIHAMTWPIYDVTLLDGDTMTLAVQVDGKVRATIVVDAGLSEEEILSTVHIEKDIVRWTEGKVVEREIYVPGKIVSIVLKG